MFRDFVLGFPIVLMDQLLETEKILKFKETGDSGCIYQKELDETCFQHDMAYGDFKDLLKRTYDKELRGYAFIIGKNPRYDGYQRLLRRAGKIRVSSSRKSVLLKAS